MKAKKYYSNLLAGDLVSVQPMSLPQGTIIFSYASYSYGFLRVVNFDSDEFDAYEKELRIYLGNDYWHGRT